MTYTVLTTCPSYGSRNVGDKLIEQRVKDLVSREKGRVEFVTIFREEPLDAQLDQINESRAVLLPAFPIRDTPMYPATYRLVDDLTRIKPPLIPIGGNWNVYPGDTQSRRAVRYSEKTVAFLQHVAGQVEHLSCREYGVCEVLANHGITNTLMTGDPAWYDLPSIGKPMYRPRQINSVAFSPPLSPYYAHQGEQIMRMLATQFPDARRYSAMHLADAGMGDDAQGQRAENSAAMSPEVARKNQHMRTLASELGFEVLELAGRLEGMAAYDELDLHVGYECHAHMYFVSKAPAKRVDCRGCAAWDSITRWAWAGLSVFSVRSRRRLFSVKH